MLKPTDKNSNKNRAGILLNIPFIQKLTEYLGTKPYNEAAVFIDGLKSGNYLQGYQIDLIEAVLNKQQQKAIDILTKAFEPPTPVKKDSTS